MDRYVSYNALVAVGPKLPVASVMNKAGVYVAPNASVFPFYKEELPDNISSPKWNALSLNDTCAPLPFSSPSKRPKNRGRKSSLDLESPLFKRDIHPACVSLAKIE